MIEEFGRIRYEPIAAAAIFTLEKPEHILRVLSLLELEHDEVLVVRQVALQILGLTQVELVAGHYFH